MTTPTEQHPGATGAYPGLLDWLSRNGVEYELHEHSATVTALETAHLEHIDPRRFAKTVIAELAGGKRVMLVLDAADHVDLSKAVRHLGSTHLRLVTESELAEIAPEIEVGAMPPVGELAGLEVHADIAIRDDPTITFAAGSHRVTATVDRAAWEHAAHVTYADMAVAVARGPAWAR